MLAFIAIYLTYFASPCRKQNASERINLQDIMQLRTAFLTADDSGDGELNIKEVRKYGHDCFVYLDVKMC